ncbi:MAG: dihydrolipoyl dehydrogenase [Undibacterium sp.]|nr:dihydrolipoyl dehydrogenase [Undibacterium sp.]
MKIVDVDVAIIGAGSAGMSAYRAALVHTKQVLVIEDAHYGTTCARVGCMPSKLLIAAAEAAHSAQHAEAFGVQVESVKVDGVAVMKRVREERDRFVGFVEETVMNWPGAHRLWGSACFIDAHTLQVGEHTQVRAKQIVIATGSSPRINAEWREAAGDRLIVNDDVFSWQTLPKSVAVLGAGVIALELAQALHRLGVRVRLYGRSQRISSLTDPVLQELALSIFQNECPVTMNASDLQLSRSGDEIVVTTGTQQERFQWVLAASGRTPNTQKLALMNAGLRLDEHGVPSFNRYTGQIEDSHIFIAGDVNRDLEILHEATDEGKIAGDNAGRFPNIREHRRRTPLAIIFSDPQVMIAGTEHAELIRQGVDFAVGAVSFSNQGRSRVMLKNKGALHLYAERGSGRLLGAEMIGPSAEHLGHLLAWSIQRGDTVSQMLDYPFYHPVIEEGLRTALQAVKRALTTVKTDTGL